MMDHSTPLTQVAHLLPAVSAERVLLLSMSGQMRVLAHLRTIITHWEQTGVQFDPITFAKAIDPVVDRLVILHAAQMIPDSESDSMEGGRQ